MSSRAVRIVGVVTLGLVLIGLLLGARAVWPTAWFEAGRVAYVLELHRPTRALLMSFAHRYPRHELAPAAVSLVLDDLVSADDLPAVADVMREVDGDAALRVAVNAERERELR